MLRNRSLIGVAVHETLKYCRKFPNSSRQHLIPAFFAHEKCFLASLAVRSFNSQHSQEQAPAQGKPEPTDGTVPPPDQAIGTL